MESADAGAINIALPAGANRIWDRSGLSQWLPWILGRQQINLSKADKLIFRLTMYLGLSRLEARNGRRRGSAAPPLDIFGLAAAESQLTRDAPSCGKIYL